MNSGLVSVTIVTFNSANLIGRCLQYVFMQDYPQVEIIVVDNASRDGTQEVLRRFANEIRIVFNQENVGFAAGQNQAIAMAQGDWVLTLNPDVRLEPDFLSKALAGVDADPDESVGCVSGKLLRMNDDFEIPETKILDSTGIYFTPALRHFDRGSGEPDEGKYENYEYVFGVTGAAGLYCREMINDVSVGGEFFDRDFFAYREDADLAWRAQLLGWKCLYVPDAIAYHVRQVLPSNRSSLAAIVNMHSVKNRFLMRIKNITPDLYFRHLLTISYRDLLVFGACLLREHSSLPAFGLALRSYKSMLAKRKEIMQRRQAESKCIAAWFSDNPVSFPAPHVSDSLVSPR